MLHPSAFELPYERIAIYATYSRFRVRIWEWPVPLRNRVMVAALVASDSLDAARAAIAAARSVIEEMTHD